MKRVLLLLFTISLFYGCATKINAEYIIPARSTDVMKYHTIAVTEFSGKNAQQYSHALESFISNLKHKNKKLYNVVDRINVKKIIDEQNFQMAVADDATVVELGKLIGVEAIWSGYAAETYSDTPSYETRTRCASYDKSGNCSYYSTYTVRCNKRSAGLTLTPKLISVSTGQLIYSRSIEEQDSSYTCGDSFITSQRSVESILLNLRNKALAKLRKDIAPTVTYIEIELKDDDKGLIDKPTKQLFENALEFAEANRLERSCEIWREIIKNNQASISINYNIGICLEVEGKVQEALDQMRYTDKLLIKPDILVTSAIKRGESNVQRMKELKEQLKN